MRHRLGIHDRTDETTTVDSISDTVNGTWSGGLGSGPTDHAGGTYRVWTYYLLNAGAGTPVVTVNFSASISSQLVVGWIADSSANASTFDGAATAANVIGANTTATSNNFTSAGDGGIVGFLCVNNAQTDPEPTADGAGEARVSPALSGGRSFLFFESYSAAGSYGFSSTIDSASYIFQVIGLLAPAGAGGMPVVGPGAEIWRRLVEVIHGTDD